MFPKIINPIKGKYSSNNLSPNINLNNLIFIVINIIEFAGLLNYSIYKALNIVLAGQKGKGYISTLFLLFTEGPKTNGNYNC